MNLIRQSMKKSITAGKAFSQITLDDDYIVPDSKPDIVKVIHTSGMIVCEEPKLSNQSVWLKGKLEFTVLYRSDRGSDNIETLKGAIPFQEKLNMEGVGDRNPIHTNWEIEDLNVGIINSRKMGVRAVIGITAHVDQNMEELLTEGAEEPGEYQQKKKDMVFLNLVLAKKDVLRVKNEITLPSSKPNIFKLLWHHIQPENLESELESGKMKISGELMLQILYRSEADEQVQWYETRVPFHGELDCPDANAADIFWNTLDPVTLEVEAKGDYDGEERLLVVDVVFDAGIKIWREQKYTILEDLFSLGKKVIPERKKEILYKLLVKNRAKLRLSQQVHMEREEEKILQICAYEGSISIDRQEQMKDGVMVEGVLTVNILYITPADHLPLERVKEVLPFEQLIEVPLENPEMEYELTYGVDQISVNLLDNHEFEIKAGISIDLIAMKPETVWNIVDTGEEPLCMEELQNMPGLIGYVVNAGEELWDIAKKYHTTVEELMKVNRKKTNLLQPGERLIIVKEIETIN